MFDLKLCLLWSDLNFLLISGDLFSEVSWESVLVFLVVHAIDLFFVYQTDIIKTI